ACSTGQSRRAPCHSSASAPREQERIFDAYFVGDSGGVLPFALTDPEVQAPDEARALEPCAIVILLERELDRHFACDAAQRQLADGCELAAPACLEAIRHIGCRRPFLHGE